MMNNEACTLSLLRLAVERGLDVTTHGIVARREREANGAISWSYAVAERSFIDAEREVPDDLVVSVYVDDVDGETMLLGFRREFVFVSRITNAPGGAA